MHPRRLLRKALLELLEDATDVHVTDKNARAVPIPSIQITYGAEVTTDLTLRGANESRRTSFLFILRAKGDDVLDELDELAETVEDALGDELDAGGDRAGVTYSTMDLELDAQQDDRIGTMTLTFDLAYAAQRGTP